MSAAGSSDDIRSTLDRVSTGLPQLDQRLGGGLIPGTLAVIVGATGIGKSQLGMHFANTIGPNEQLPGTIIDLCSRGDSQSHDEYVQRMFGRTLKSAVAHQLDNVGDVEPGAVRQFDRLELFTRSGMRTGRSDIDPREWDEWKSQLNRSLQAMIGFAYHRFAAGSRRLIVDGIEPTRRQADSIQFDVFEYLYHQILRKEHDWVARDLYRQRFREMRDRIMQHAYDYRRLNCVALYTSHHSMLDELIRQPLEDGDLLANANTLIFLGKIPRGNTMRRALHIAKHRGSACSDDIHEFTIHEDGLHME